MPAGDILAKSFKWIYAKVCLCRICPGVAKRRAIREKRKMRAMTMDRGSFAGVCSSIYISLKPRRIFSLNTKICNFQSADDPYLDEGSETVTSETATVYSDEFSESLGESSQSGEDTSTVTVPIMICLLIMIG